MPGTVKLWWHDGSTLDVRSHPTPLINEPELGFSSATVGATPVSFGPAPAEACVAVLEAPVNLRYRVLRAGQTGSAADPQAKPLVATLPGIAAIGIEPGATLSLIEEA
ncbi:MAG: hypothetical protein ACFBSD_10685 [Paracoccaceae bacterium]